ncbi:hypothetical protein G6F24_017728 [Rhizopus arrhizus]|nr:hypothetical protein G6F24_017728 [Rhizopus arrhizus]
MRRARRRSFSRLSTAKAWPMAAGLSREASMRLRSAWARPLVCPLAAASASSVELASTSLGDRRAQTRAASSAPPIWRGASGAFTTWPTACMRQLMICTLRSSTV